jgi:16S rRNA (cytosine967-C5)-methyltransferase
VTPGARIQAAIEILEGLNATAMPADRFIRDWFRTRRYAGSKDRAAVAERVYDVYRHRASYAWRMGSETPRALAIASVLAEEGNVDALFSGGGYGPVPLDDSERAAVLAPPDGEPPVHARYEFPEFLWGELERSLGPALAGEMNAMQARAPVDLRVNMWQATPEYVLERLRAEGIDAQPMPYSPYGVRVAHDEDRTRLGKSEIFDVGYFEPQDESGQIAVILAQAKPGERVLDIAAGTGGKAIALGAEMHNEGAIVACDIAANRLMKIRERAELAAISIIRVHNGEPPREEFDLVFVDAPCSGSGTWRRQPEQKWRLTEARLDELKSIQDELLEKAAARVRPGGRIVYATCSLLRCENEDRIESFLAKHSEFTVRPAADVWRETPDSPIPPGMAEYFRATPATTGTDGFFAAILQRSGT